jgi:hypothetical protein
MEPHSQLVHNRKKHIDVTARRRRPRVAEALAEAQAMAQAPVRHISICFLCVYVTPMFTKRIK